ncbi:Mitogen-activated protein kinase 14 [Planktothrix agardhii]|jgi:serine/threonine protein kinase|uniref:Pkn1 n=2 Tax=Planktothrix agardhii TaxID=1160 RepID=A0A073CDX3_PLAA1|nr:Pkn1 [Planktothrix agardhii NIVA-CYA 126/8]BBD54750.1 serine/threonine protein kinase [Planktothrix agardhii NIES-204]CAD5919596.1 Mitogen-activated protein kinase 14 [Planktothrix agardhii]
MCYRVPDRYVQTGEKLSGGMGDVLICTDTYLDRPVAIKFIQNVQDENRLVDELNALQKLRSKHVVQIFDVFIDQQDNDRIGIVQEYVSGQDLLTLINQTSFSLDQYLKILYQLASGISDIHAQGVIHRDIKPNNMKIDQENILKIFDFGLARFTGKNDSTQGFTGTLGFAAPELYHGDYVSFTQAVDTYAFGVTAWFLSKEKIPDSLLKIPPDFTTSLPSFSSLSLNLPDQVSQLLDLTLSEDPKNRPDMSDVRNLLGKYLLFGKHKALIVLGRNVYSFEKINQVVKLDVPNQGLVHIKYNGLDFVIEFVNGAVYVNNESVLQGHVFPTSCVITLGESSPSNNRNRSFITFDISNPEVVL